MDWDHLSIRTKCLWGPNELGTKCVTAVAYGHASKNPAIGFIFLYPLLCEPLTSKAFFRYLRDQSDLSNKRKKDPRG